MLKKFGIYVSSIAVFVIGGFALLGDTSAMGYTPLVMSDGVISNIQKNDRILVNANFCSTASVSMFIAISPEMNGVKMANGQSYEFDAGQCLDVEFSYPILTETAERAGIISDRHVQLSYSISVEGVYDAYSINVGEMDINMDPVYFKSMQYSLDRQNQSAFTDISFGSEYFDAAQYFHSQELINGYDDGSFKPSNLITRAEFTKIILLAAGFKTGIDISTMQDSQYLKRTHNVFSDVVLSDWYDKYIYFAYNKNILGGYNMGYKTEFRPNNNINFAEASKIIVNTLVRPTEPTAVGPWYSEYILILNELDVIPASLITVSYEGDRAAKVDNNLTRGQMIQIVYYILQSNNTLISSSEISR